MFSSLQCKWCPSMNICSDGVDRNRQFWLKKCDSVNYHVREKPMCDVPLPNPPPSVDDHNGVNFHYPDRNGLDSDEEGNGTVKAGLNDEDKGPSVWS